MNNLSKYYELASRAVVDRSEATYLARAAAGALPAWLSTRYRVTRLPRQGDRLCELRDQEAYLLVVLDACRYDVFAEVAPEYLSFADLEPVRSEGRNTFEYVSRCWDGTFDDVEYLSAAPPVSSDDRETYKQDTLNDLYGGFVPSEHISSIRDIWRESWNESIGITPPEPVTEAALETEADRLVVHYFQPHTPYIGRRSLLGHTSGEDARPREGEPVDVPVWNRIKSGDVTRAELGAVYESNLRRALRSVRRLVVETDADTVAIMGDHGEALGEYGLHGHPDLLEHPYVRTVPWAIVEGSQEYPDREETADDVSSSVESRLRSLGYVD